MSRSAVTFGALFFSSMVLGVDRSCGAQALPAPAPENASPGIASQGVASQGIASQGIERHQTAAGLRVLRLPHDGAARFHLVAFVGSGSRHENAGNRGTAHMLSQVLLGSTQKRTWRQLRREFRVHAADRVGWTAPGHTVFGITVPLAHWRFAATWLGEALTRPLLLAEDLDGARRLMAEEIEVGAPPTHGRYSLPIDHLEALYPRHPLAWSVSGTTEDARRLGRSELADFLRDHYVRKNVWIGFAGDVASGECLPALQESFADLPDGPAPDDGPAPRVTTGKQVLPDSSPLSSWGEMELGFHLTARQPRDLLVQCVLREYLAERFTDEVRDEHRLAYQPLVALDLHADTQRLFFHAQAGERHNLRSIIDIADELLAEVETPRPEALQRSIARVRDGFVVDHHATLADALQLCALYEQLGAPADRIPAALDAIDRTDLRDLRDAQLVSERRYFLTDAATLGRGVLLWPVVLLACLVLILADAYRGFPFLLRLRRLGRSRPDPREPAPEAVGLPSLPPAAPLPFSPVQRDRLVPISGEELERHIQRYFADEDQGRAS